MGAGCTKLHVLLLMPATPPPSALAPHPQDAHQHAHSPSHAAGDPAATLDQLPLHLASSGAAPPADAAHTAVAAAPFAPRPHLARALAAGTCGAAVQLDVEVVQPAAGQWGGGGRTSGGALGPSLRRGSGRGASGRSLGSPPPPPAAYGLPHGAPAGWRERGGRGGEEGAGAGWERPGAGDDGHGVEEMEAVRGEEEEGGRVECLSEATAALSLQQHSQLAVALAACGGACIWHNSGSPRRSAGGAGAGREEEVEQEAEEVRSGGGAAATQGGGAVWWQCRTVVHGLPSAGASG